MASSRLRGTRVVVAGAGFAGLAAALSLQDLGAEVFVVEARDRVGGRVWTQRGFTGGQHAEGGADLIEGEHTAVFELAERFRLRTTRILRKGFGYYGRTPRGRLAVQPLTAAVKPVRKQLSSLIRAYELSEQRWDTAIAGSLGRRSVADWLTEIRAPAWVRERFRGWRGLFLADPDDLSLLALVDFLTEEPTGRPGTMFRLADGNDTLATSIVERLHRKPQMNSVLRRVRQHAGGIVAAVQARGAHLDEIEADALISTLPATTLRDVVFEPALPEAQAGAIATLGYGAATRMLLQFSRRFWRRGARPRAFGSDQPTGAVWEGNEQQRGSCGILSLLAGGGASREIREVLDRKGWAGVVDQLRWLGKPPDLLQASAIHWEDDPWARGGYAVFDPSFDPQRRALLAQPAGRIFFAGEHTSIRWQGYMNGAIESGQRAAEEVVAVVSSSVSRPPSRRR